jgi:hypothetical protein
MRAKPLFSLDIRRNKNCNAGVTFFPTVAACNHRAITPDPAARHNPRASHARPIAR